jgi:4-amino-4-deoxy-L-arabinose transferase-like glycosyltransferase
MKAFNNLADNSTKSILFLLALSSIFFIGLGYTHLFDWDEINFAESAREMIFSGDYLRVQINYEPFWEKPPLFFWLQVGSMKLFGINEFAARFPNALFGALYLVSIYLIGKKHFNARFGLTWALIYFGTILPHIYFKSGIIDPVFNYFIFMSIYFMMLVVSGNQENRSKLSLYSGLFSGLSVITKGPVGFLLLGLTLFVFLAVRKFKPFPKLKYILFFFLGLILIIVGWLSIEIFNNGLDIIRKFIEYQAELFSSDVAGHAQPFYYHFVVVFFGCFPISILALPSLFKKRWELPFEMNVWMLCLFWSVLILFSIVTTKIIHYSSMTWIPLSFIAAINIHKAMIGEFSFKKAIRITFVIVGILIGVAMIAVPLLFMNKEVLIPLMNDQFAVDSMNQLVHWYGIEIIGGVLFLIGTIIGFVQLNRNKIQHFLITTASSLSISLILVLFLVIPKVEKITQGPAIEFYQELKGQDAYVEVYGFKSYAHFFYFEQPTGMTDEQKQMNWLVHGKVDKPVYLVTKSTNNDVDNFTNFSLVKQKGGFKLYKREL